MHDRRCEIRHVVVRLLAGILVATMGPILPFALTLENYRRPPRLGFAGDYVRAMRLAVLAEHPDDYVVATKAREILGWVPRVTFNGLVEMMVESERATRSCGVGAFGRAQSVPAPGTALALHSTNVAGMNNSQACRTVGVNRRTVTRWRLGHPPTPS